jgi:aldose 1-epimerase
MATPSSGEPGNTVSGLTPASGRQVEIAAGPYQACIASVGASLRLLRHDGRDLVVPFPAHSIRPLYRGATLAPWPNRIIDGRYRYDGQTQQLSITEVDRHHALHGLVIWHDFEVVEWQKTSAELHSSIPAQTGYPHQIDVDVRFVIGESGLITTVTGTNRGETTAPWGTSGHPYLVAGPGKVDDWILELPASRVLTVSAERLIPQGLVAISDEPDLDFRSPRRVNDTFIDHAFTDLIRDSDGIATVRLTTQTGDGVAMTWDSVCPWVQIHTGDRPEPSDDRIGLAVEPMTCAPDAFNSGQGLVHLEPGATHSASWRLSAL